MKKLIKFPSIEQFRNVVASINRSSTFVGLDENGEAIYDGNQPKPKITFKGTVKLHGTNAAVCYNEADGLWSQSRENVLTVTKDNAGFAWFVDANIAEFTELIKQVQEREKVDLTKNTISIYGEWAGGNIQQGVGIANIEKAFFIFGVKISPIIDEMSEEDKLDKKEIAAYWVDYSGLKNEAKRIYNILDYQTWEIEIDFNFPQLKQNELAEITNVVEALCPVTKAFGFTGIGEGVVWTGEYKGYLLRFKVKGQEHSSSKVKTLASIDIEKVRSVIEFIESVVTESRVKQAIENVFPNNEPLDIKKTGDVIRWVLNDIIKEESDTMQANGIEPKEINSHVSKLVRTQFLKVLETKLN